MIRLVRLKGISTAAILFGAFFAFAQNEDCLDRIVKDSLITKLSSSSLLDNIEDSLKARSSQAFLWFDEKLKGKFFRRRTHLMYRRLVFAARSNDDFLIFYEYHGRKNHFHLGVYDQLGNELCNYVTYSNICDLDDLRDAILIDALEIDPDNTF